MKSADTLDLKLAIPAFALLMAMLYAMASRECDLYGQCELASGALWRLINPLLL